MCKQHISFGGCKKCHVAPFLVTVKNKNSSGSKLLGRLVVAGHFRFDALIVVIFHHLVWNLS